MEYPQFSEYEKQMIAAFIDKPEKEVWYEHAFSKYSINGIDKMSWVWSWWAFAGGPLFLLYRKAYMAAGILFALSILFSVIPFGSVIVWILSGGYSTYFVYKVYQAKKREIEAKINDEQERIETMHILGGYHQWVVWLGALLVFLWLAGLVTFVSTVGMY